MLKRILYILIILVVTSCLTVNEPSKQKKVSDSDIAIFYNIKIYRDIELEKRTYKIDSVEHVFSTKIQDNSNFIEIEVIVDEAKIGIVEISRDDGLNILILIDQRKLKDKTISGEIFLTLSEAKFKRENYFYTFINKYDGRSGKVKKVFKTKFISRKKYKRLINGNFDKK
jgi:hypothetical protein